MDKSKNNWENTFFCFHRGLLKDALKTKTKVYSYENLYNLIIEKWKINKLDTKVTIESYKYDHRINRAIFRVLISTLLNEGKEVVTSYPIGFLFVDEKG